MSAADLRKELKELRKESVKPVSRMKKGDVLLELERLRGKRESTAPVASIAASTPKKMEAKIADVKVAKEQGFPMKPVEESKAKKGKGSAVPKTTVADKKPSKMEKLKMMLEAMSSSDEE